MDDRALEREVQLLRKEVRAFARHSSKRFATQRARVRYMERCLHLIEESTAPLLTLWKEWVAAKAFLKRIRPMVVWLLKFVIAPVGGMVAFSALFDLEGWPRLVNFLVELIGE